MCGPGHRPLTDPLRCWAPDHLAYAWRARDSRCAIQIVDPQMTAPPISVEVLADSENTSQPIADAHTRSRNLTDWVDEMSATANPRVMQ